MKSKAPVIFAGILAAITVCACVGCGNSGKEAGSSSAASSASSSETSSSEASSSEASSPASSSEASSSGASTTESKDSSDGSSSDGSGNAEYAGISEQDAVTKALDEAGSGSWKATGSSKGTYDEQEAWIVALVNEDDGQEKTAFVSGSFCNYAIAESESSDSSGSADYAGISEQDAGIKALEYVGSASWKIIQTSKGTYDGEDVWIVIIADMDEINAKVAYVNGSSITVVDMEG